jgi:cysteine-rich repeat protein
MHKRLTRIAFVLIGWCPFVGCVNNPGEVSPISPDASPPGPDLGPDISRDVQPWVGLPDAWVASEICSNGVLEGTEECDDGNLKTGDGCNNFCQLEPGWSCLVPGTACLPKCGDGLQTAGEKCDDGNTNSGDG